MSIFNNNMPRGKNGSSAYGSIGGDLPGQESAAEWRPGQRYGIPSEGFGMQGNPFGIEGEISPEPDPAVHANSLGIYVTAVRAAERLNLISVGDAMRLLDREHPGYGDIRSLNIMIRG